MPQFQVASDLHLEFYEANDQPCQLEVSAPYLILAGDIGYPFEPHYAKYLSDVSSKYTKVFVISGNHEYYSRNDKKSMTVIDAKIDEICTSLGNVFYLNNRSIVVEGVRLVGTTLWTQVSDESKSYVGSAMNDYRCIYNDDKSLITPDDTNAYHFKNLEWLTSELHKYANEQVVVITHHLPSSVFIHKKYFGHPINEGFMTNLEMLMKKPVVAWIGGHTHCSINLVYKKIKCIVNPLGYPGENPDFKKTMIFECCNGFISK
jgi:predicted phosphohydrolase